MPVYDIKEAEKRLPIIADSFGVGNLAKPVFDFDNFWLWSGSSREDQHHYGKGGLAVHTHEVVELCLANVNLLNLDINMGQMFLAALYHDIGKIWDYIPDDDTGYTKYDKWTTSEHKFKIHHITRSALVWQEQAKIHKLNQSVTDEILHCILSHHGLKEWGSPVEPKTQMAWMLHLCDGISARISDNGGYKNK